MADVKRKALMRLEYEGDCTMRNDHAAAYAMEKYAYYVCFKCKKVSANKINKITSDLAITNAKEGKLFFYDALGLITFLTFGTTHIIFCSFSANIF